MSLSNNSVGSYQTIRYERKGEIALLTFGRPEKRNALDLVMRKEIGQAVWTAADDDAVKVLVLTGSGGSFCSGGDIDTMKSRTPGAAAGRQRMKDNWEWVQQLIQLDKPVIAAVDGGAVGAGFNIALAADFILSSPNAYFCESFVKIGLVPDLGGLYLLPRIVGLQRAKEIVFSGRKLSAEEALELGIVYKIVPQDKLLHAAMTLAETLTKGSGVGMGIAKSILNNSFQSDLRNVLDLEASANGICFETDYHKAAIEKFLKREPFSFSGFTANDSLI